MKRELFYHASAMDYEEGLTYSSKNFHGTTNYSHQSMDCKYKEINLQIDKFRPKGYYSRINSIFLFDDLNLCRFFATKKRGEVKDEKEIKIYKVKPTSKLFGGFPMCVLKKIYDNKDNKELMARIIEEYWYPKPSNKWKFKEYLAKEILILDKVDFKPLQYCGHYMDDFLTFKKVFGV